MATKKKTQETLYMVLDLEEQRDAIVDWYGNAASMDEVVFDDEKSATEAAEDALQSEADFEAATYLTVYKLVPVAKVKRAKAVVEKL